MKEIKYCELNSNNVCNNCRDCDRCDLFPDKFCDNCGKCLEIESLDYSEIKIDGILGDEFEIDDYVLEPSEMESLHKFDSYLKADKAGDYDFIEDIPKLKDEYDKKLIDILMGNDKED